MIKLEKVSKTYGENVIFKDVSYTFTQQKTKIKGDNGVGKSVLLKLIVGYSLPDCGYIFYAEDRQLRKEADFLEDAGISINAPEFMKNWTGLENLLYLAEIRHKADENKILELAEVLGLKDSLSKKYKTYSLGMKQKMRLIQAIMDEPRYLILDEPFDALDDKAKRIVKTFIEQYLQTDKRRMLIYTSHSEEDDSFADELVYINNHNLVSEK